MISFIVIGIFPSISHSQLAAIDPMILDLTRFFEVTIISVEYAKYASPAPTASNKFSQNEGTECAGKILPFFDTHKEPLDP